MGELAKIGGVTTLTVMQEKLVAGLLSGLKNDAAGELAGYVEPGSVRRAIASPAVQAALKAGRTAIIRGELSNQALEAMGDLLKPGTPAATRLGAAKWVLEHGDASQDDDNTPIHLMTPKQLEAFMARAQAVIDEGGSPPIIDVTPNNGALPS